MSCCDGVIPGAAVQCCPLRSEAGLVAACLPSWTTLRSSVCLFPPFLTLFHSVSLFHTSHPTVADTCLRNASDRCLSRFPSQLHLGHLFNLRQRGTLPLTPFSFPPLRAAPWPFSSNWFRDVGHQSGGALAGRLPCCSISVSPLFCLFLLLTQAVSLSLQNSIRQQRLAPFHSIIVGERQFDPFDE